MRDRGPLAVAALGAFCLLAAAARAAEPDPWAGEPAEVQERMTELAEAEVAGEIGAEELAELNKYWATHLRRGPMNALESAQYSIAELQLQRGDAQAALTTLQKVLETCQGDDIRDLTQLNLAEIYRRRLNDPTNALTQYRRIAGPLRYQARHYMLTMLTETGKPDQAAKLLEDLAAGAKEKGERLALLHRLAAHFKHMKMEDQALAVYQRITKDFAPADIQQMCAAAVHEADGVIARIAALRQKDDEDAAERLEQRLHQRARELRLAQRWDELRAFDEAVRKGLDRLRGEEAGPEERRDEGAPKAKGW